MSSCLMKADSDRSLNFNPRNVETSREDPSVPYPSVDEVFARANCVSAVEDESFSDLARSDAVDAFRVSAQGHSHRNREYMSTWSEGLLRRGLFRDPNEPCDSVLETSMGYAASIGAMALGHVGVQESKVRLHRVLSLLIGTHECVLEQVDVGQRPFAYGRAPRVVRGQR